MELLVIENLLKIITSIILWMAIGQILLLAAIYFRLRAILTATRKQGDNNSNNKSNAINDGIEK